MLLKPRVVSNHTEVRKRSDAGEIRVLAPLAEKDEFTVLRDGYWCEKEERYEHECVFGYSKSGGQTLHIGFRGTIVTREWLRYNARAKFAKNASEAPSRTLLHKLALLMSTILLIECP